MAQLEIRHVSRRFGDFVAADNVSLGIEAGEFFTLPGTSGCGKTTIPRMIAGFDLQRDVGIRFAFVTHAQVEALALSRIGIGIKSRLPIAMTASTTTS